MEASGVITAVGKEVDPSQFKVGDRVICSKTRCFTNRLNVMASRVIPMPDSLSMEDAAAIMTAYSTAHWSLVHLARVRPGDKVLVHAGAGGVGHAAIAICQHFGAEVIATASKAKQHIVRALGVEHVFDSRSTSWFDDVMRLTGGKGVNMVLNSLAGQHQKLGLQVLCPGGHFLEIGKMDIYNNSKLDLLPFRKNVSFHAIDMDR